MNRPSVKNPKGGYSSVLSTSFETNVDGRTMEVLIPQVIKVGGSWRIVSGRQAYQYFLKTHQHLGMFDTPTHANMYANRLHLQQASLGGGG